MKKISFLLFLTLSINKSYAVPAYARNLKVSCTQCHSVFPMLNKYGRHFKESLAEKLKQEYADEFQSVANPLAARLKFRAYDKTTDMKNPSMRALHEIEVFITGRTGKVFYNAEMEAEDETPTLDKTGAQTGFGLNAYFSQAYMGYQISNSLNFLIGLASPLAYDSLGTLHHHNIMRGQWKASDFLQAKSQFMSVAGQVSKLTYFVSFYGEAYDEANVASNGIEGKNPRNILARVKYNLMGQNIGFMYANENGGDMKRMAFDTLFEFGELTARAVFATTDVKISSTTQDKNHDLSLEMYYLFDNFTPMIGLDSYTKSDGNDSYTNGQIALLYNFAENIRADLNFETKLSVAKNEAKTGRFSLRGEVAF